MTAGKRNVRSERAIIAARAKAGTVPVPRHRDTELTDALARIESLLASMDKRLMAVVKRLEYAEIQGRMERHNALRRKPDWMSA